MQGCSWNKYLLNPLAKTIFILWRRSKNVIDIANNNIKPDQLKFLLKNTSYSCNWCGTCVSVTGAAGVVASGGDVNVAELLQKLMATGIMPSLAPSQPKDRKVPEKPAAADSVLIKPVDFRKPDSLKM